MEQKESLLGALPEELKEKGSLLFASLTDGKVLHFFSVPFNL